jgi:hypothetical protein
MSFFFLKTSTELKIRIAEATNGSFMQLLKFLISLKLTPTPLPPCSESKVTFYSSN